MQRCRIGILLGVRRRGDIVTKRCHRRFIRGTIMMMVVVVAIIVMMMMIRLLETVAMDKSRERSRHCIRRYQRNQKDSYHRPQRGQCPPTLMTSR